MPDKPTPARRRFPNQPDFIGRYLREAWTFLLDDLDRGLRADYPDVTPAQSRIITLLDREGMRLVDLAARAQLTKQSAGELVAGLEHLGLVERVPDPTDGRAKLVVPTADGVRAMERGLAVVQSVHRQWTALIGDDEMATLMRTLGSLVAALSAR